MDWKSGLISFGIIFLSELGDKTQLMIMSMSAGSKSPQAIFFGAATALIASSLVAVMAGELFLRAVPMRLVQFGSGLAFMGIGGVLLYRCFR